MTSKYSRGIESSPDRCVNHKGKALSEGPTGTKSWQNHQGFSLPLTLKQLHIHLDVVSFPWWLQTDTSLPEERQCHLFRRGCVCVHTCQPVSTHKIFALILQWKSVSSSSLLCCFRLSRWESEIEKSTETMTESHAQRQKHKERDSRHVLLPWLIFFFHCFSTSVICVKVIWVSVKVRFTNRKFSKRWEKRRWAKGWICW